MDRLVIDIKLISHVFNKFIISTNYLFVFIALFVVILSVLQWLFNIEQLIEIINADSLNLAEKLDVFIGAFFDLFKFADNIRPISMIIIAFLQASSVTLMIIFKRYNKKQVKEAKYSVGSASMALLGVGCVACGGSLLTPIVSLFSATISLTLANAISAILLMLAIVLSYISLSKTAFLLASNQTEIKQNNGKNNQT